MLDCVYTNITEAYQAKPFPYLRHSDHIPVTLIPAYQPRVKRIRPSRTETRTWPEGAMSAPDCFECTDWDISKQAATYNGIIDLEEYTSAVTSYICKCTEDVSISKTITTHPNQKPWKTVKVSFSLHISVLSSFWTLLNSPLSPDRKTLLFSFSRVFRSGVL